METNGNNGGRGPLQARLRAIVAMLVWRPLTWLCVGLFGRLEWQAPAWGRSLASASGRAGQSLRAHPRASLAALSAITLLAAGGWYGVNWWKAQPKPVEVTFIVTAPARTEIENDAADARKPKPARIVFDHPVAPLAQVGKEIAAGIALAPATAGIWLWLDDKTLTFTPKDDWAAGATYTVRFEPTLFKPEARLAENSATFAAAGFAATIIKAGFYQDPLNAAVKKVVIDLGFTYPVNSAELEKRVALQQVEQQPASNVFGILGIGKTSTRFTVSYDKLKLHAYVASEDLPIPKDGGKLRFSLAPGLTAARGSPALGTELTRDVALPGLYSLAITDITAKVVSNDKNEPEQLLVLQSSATVHERAMQQALAVWVLPKFHPDPKLRGQDDAPYSWNPAEITDALLKQSTRLTLDAVPAEREYTDLYSFKYHAAVGARLYVQVAKGVKSFGGYLLGKTDAHVLDVPPYPSELKILSQGALLALSGEKKVALLVRDLPGVKIEIGRVLPSQLQHLVSQSGGNFANPTFYDSFGADNLVERFERKLALPNLERGRAHYEAIDMGEYLKGEGAERRGVFLLTVSGYDPKTDARAAKNALAARRQPGEAPVPVPSQQANDVGEGDGEGASDANADNVNLVDQRLVLVTDLGIVVKKSPDGSQDVYVQSIFSGKPVDGAGVDIVGVNGQVLFTKPTDASGHAHFAKIDALARERAPLMILARKGGDLSFMPLNRHDRGLDMSRFDTGGAKNAGVADQLSAYLFSDRGLYRPGDTFHVGIIAKSADWGTSITGLPLEIDILDARGLTVKHEKITLPAGGFIETAYNTLESAPSAIKFLRTSGLSPTRWRRCRKSACPRISRAMATSACSLFTTPVPTRFS